MKVILSGAAIVLAALAVTACGISGNSGGYSAQGPLSHWLDTLGEEGAYWLQGVDGPAAISDATGEATAQSQGDAANMPSYFQGDIAKIQRDVAQMKADPPPEDTSDWAKAIASYLAAVSYLRSGNTSAAVSDLNAGSASISTFGDTVGDPLLETFGSP
jgi:hypothetical protein